MNPSIFFFFLFWVFLSSQALPIMFATSLTAFTFSCVSFLISTLMCFLFHLGWSHPFLNHTCSQKSKIQLEINCYFCFIVYLHHGLELARVSLWNFTILGSLLCLSWTFCKANDQQPQNLYNHPKKKKKRRILNRLDLWLCLQVYNNLELLAQICKIRVKY